MQASDFLFAIILVSTIGIGGSISKWICDANGWGMWPALGLTYVAVFVLVVVLIVVTELIFGNRK